MFVTRRFSVDDCERSPSDSNVLNGFSATRAGIILTAALVSIANTVTVGIAAAAGAGKHATALDENQQNRIADVRNHLNRR